LNRFLKDTVYRNAWLLIAAAWLFTLSFIFSNYWSYTSSPQGVRKNLENYLQRQENDFNAFAKDTALIRRLIHTRESEQELARNTSTGFGVFIYVLEPNGPIDLRYWNTQQVLPTDELLARPEGEYLEKMPNGQYAYIKRRLTLPDQTALLVCGLIPVHYNYFVENDYLRNGFAGSLSVDRKYAIAEGSTGYPVNSVGGKTLYFLEKKGEEPVASNDWITILLRILGSLFFLLYLHFIALGISRHFGVGWGIGFLLVTVLVLRVLSYSFNIPVNYGQFELFSPRIYGSNLILRSLGDLLINALLFVWLALFWRGQVNKYDLKLVIANRSWRMLAYVAMMAALFFVTVLVGGVIRSLVADSSISYDVTNFFSLNIYSIFGFIVLCCVSMGYFILSNIIFQLASQLWEAPFLQRALPMALIGLGYLSLRLHQTDNLFQLVLLIWLLLYLYLVSRTHGEISRRISGSATVFWIFLFSASITVIIITANTEREFDLMRKGAEKKAYQADPASEKVMSITVQSITNGFLLANLPRFANEEEGPQLKDSLVNKYSRAYLNRFETRLFLYDPAGKPLSASDQLTYDTLNTIFTILGRKTKFPELKYYETSFDNINYILRREVRDSSVLKGYFFMVSKPRRYQGESLYPELIKTSEELSFEGSPNYSYAVYDKGLLLFHQNDYPFSYRLNPEDIPQAEFNQKNRNGYQELWYKVGNDRVVVITRKSNFLLEAITLFAWLFCAFLLLLGLFHLVSLVIRSGFQVSKAREFWQLSIKNQIYGTIIFVSIFSFVVIFAATMVFFIQRFNRNNQEKLSRTIQVMANELKTQMYEHSATDDGISVYDSVNMATVQKDISDISEIHNADVNLYDSSGTLMVSSQPFYYSNGLLSRKMDPVAFYEMKRLSRIQFIQDEKFGAQKYLSIYVPLHDDRSELKAYLNIPYFASNRYLNQEISNFLVAIINLNAFIILIGGVIAVFITNRITRSFSWIGEKMREVSLGRHNEEITWGRRDELGGLVVEYNKMVQKLEASAMALAKTEREGAWREMARQVAHEIKNPLTPMKLSIQYLQKAIDNNAPNVKELSTNVARTLIEQIEHLSKIAAEFSQFANIGNTRLEAFDLHELLHSLVSLHSMQDLIDVQWEPLDQKLMIRADRTQINRLFTNLLQNATEAVPEGQQGVIRIGEKLLGGNVVVTVQDNGTGIPAETQAKIFIPNFTTKTSGTGLGLAMSKGIVEQARGEIWFETREGEGTTFFVSLPLLGEQEA
jgi:two-component system nitrogen regulation sensor histidine kinase NtrY